MVDFIMYHYVKSPENILFPGLKAMSLSDFSNQINYLKKKYRIISIEDFYYSNYDKRKKNCVLTFDDGYSDHFDCVLPVLVKNKIKGAFYCPVDVIERKKLLDVNKIQIILASTDEKRILSRILFHFKQLDIKKTLEDYISSIDFSSRWDNKETILIKRLLQSAIPYKKRSMLCDLLLHDFVDMKESEIARLWYLGRENISAMITEGMHFGAHGKKHFWFSSLQKKDQEVEIKESISFLNSVHNSPYLLTMCFPYGDYDTTTLSLLDKYKFKIGLTTKCESFYSGNSLLEIPRKDANDFYPIRKLSI